MKYLSLITCLIISIKLFSQQNSSGNNSLDISTGIFYSKNETQVTNKQLVDPKTYLLVNISPFFSLSISPTYRFKRPNSRIKTFDSEFSFHLLQPYNFSVDNISIKHFGYSIGISPIGFDIFPNSKNVDLILLAGINLGTNYLRVSGVKYKTHFLAPKARCHFRTFYKKIVFGIKIEAQFDASDPKWQTDQEQTYSVSNLNQHGYLTSISIGYKL